MLGFDLMLDENYKPWFIEVNHNPDLIDNPPLASLVIRKTINDSLEKMAEVKVGQKRHGDTIVGSKNLSLPRPFCQPPPAKNISTSAKTPANPSTTKRSTTYLTCLPRLTSRPSVRKSSPSKSSLSLQPYFQILRGTWSTLWFREFRTPSAASIGRADGSFRGNSGLKFRQ